MASISIKFGDLNLADHLDNLRISDKNRIVKQSIPFKDGASIQEALLQPIMISVDGDMLGTSAENLRTIKDTFMNKINDGKQPLRIFDDRYVTAQKQSMNYEYLKALQFLKFKIVFIGDTPFWLADTPDSNVKVISTTPTNYSFSVAGSAYAFPTITFAADQGSALSNISLENQTSGESLAYSPTVDIGNSLVIDCSEQTIENNDVDDIANFSGDFLRLVNGSNTIIYTGQDCTISIVWTDRWH